MTEAMMEIDGTTFVVEFQPNPSALVYPTKQQEKEPSDRQEVSLGDTTNSLDGTEDESDSSEDGTDVQEKKKRFRLLKKIKKQKKKKKRTDKKQSKLGSLVSSAKKISPSKILMVKLTKVRNNKQRYLLPALEEESSGSLFAGRLGNLDGELEELLPTIDETTEFNQATTTTTKSSTKLVEGKNRKMRKRWKRFKLFSLIQEKYKKQRQDDAGSTSSSYNDTTSTSTGSPTRTTMKPSDLISEVSDALYSDDSTVALASMTADENISSPPSLPRLTLVRPPSPPPAVARQAECSLPNLQVDAQDSWVDLSNSVVSPVPSPPGSPRKKILLYKKKSCKKVDSSEKRKETQAGAVKEAAIVVPSSSAASSSSKKGNMWPLLLLVTTFFGALYAWQPSCGLPQESKQAAIIGRLVDDDWAGVGSNFCMAGGEGFEMVANLAWPHDQSWSEAPLYNIIVRL